MFKKAIIVALLLGSGAVGAENISLETDANPAFQPAPESVRRLLLTDGNESDEFCKNLAVVPISLAKQNQTRYFVAAGCAGGSAAAPMWIVAENKQQTRVLLESSAYDLTILPSQHHGLRDVSTTVGHAGHCSETVYHFNGKQYRPVKTLNCLSQ